MPNTAKKLEREVRKLPAIPRELTRHFVDGPMTAEAVELASAVFKRALIEAALGTELGHYLGYRSGEDLRSPKMPTMPPGNRMTNRGSTSPIPSARQP